MDKKFLFVEKKKLIAVSIITVILIATLIILLRIDIKETKSIEKVASTDQIKAMSVVDATGVSIYSVPEGQEDEIEQNKLDGKIATMPNKGTFQVYSKVLPDDATNKEVKWESSNPEVATISEEGLITAVGIGETIISAITQDGQFKAEFTVKVPGIEIYVSDGTPYGDVNEDKIINDEDATIIQKVASSLLSITDEQKKIADVNGDNVITQEDAQLVTKCVNQEITIFPVQLKEENKITNKTIQIETQNYYKLDKQVVLSENKDIVWESTNPDIVTVEDGIINANSTGRTSVILKTLDGNYSAITNIEVTDTKAPTVEFDIPDSEEWISDDQIYVTVTDEGSKIKENSLKYKWTLAQSNKPTEEEFTNTFTNGNGINIPQNTEGEYKLWIFAKDNSDNITITESPIIKIDTKAPQATFSKQEGEIAYTDIITVTVTDNGSGIYNLENQTQAHYAWHNAEDTYYEEGWQSTELRKIANGYQFDVIVPRDLEINKQHIIVLSAAEDVIDNAGHEITPRTSPKYTYIDKTSPSKPIITVLSGKRNSKLEYITDVVVEIAQGIDYETGIDHSELIIEYTNAGKTVTTTEIITDSTKQFTFTKNGTYKLTAITYDKAGNKAQTEQYHLFIINKELTLDKDIMELNIGDMARLNVSINSTKVSSSDLTFESSNTSIATVDKYGYIKAVGTGEANIEVTTEDGNKKAICKVTVNEKQAQLNSNKYYILKTDKIILNISPLTTKEEFVKHIIANEEYKILTKENKEINDTNYITTGMKLIINNTEYTLIVKGDIDSDGDITITDLAKLKKHIILEEILTEQKLEAADINLDQDADITDLAKIVKYIIKEIIL